MIVLGKYYPQEIFIIKEAIRIMYSGKYDENPNAILLDFNGFIKAIYVVNPLESRLIELAITPKPLLNPPDTDYREVYRRKRFILHTILGEEIHERLYLYKEI